MWVGSSMIALGAIIGGVLIYIYGLGLLLYCVAAFLGGVLYIVITIEYPALVAMLTITAFSGKTG